MTIKEPGVPSVSAVVAEPYIALQDWQIDQHTFLSFAKLSLSQATELRDSLNTAITAYRSLVGQ